MSIGFTARIIFLVLMLPILLFYVWRQYHGQDGLGKRTIPKYLVALLLGIIAEALAIPRPILWPIRVLCISALFYHILAIYLATDQLINSKLQQPILRHRLVWLTTLAAAVEAILIYISRTNLGSLVDGEAVRPTLLYAVYYGLIFVIPMGIEFLCLKELWSAIGEKRGIPYTCYASGGWVALLIAFLQCGVGLINLLLFFVVGDAYRPTLNVVFLTLRPLILVPALVMLIPPVVLRAVFRPLQPTFTKHATQEKNDLIYLNRKISQVVQCVDRVPPEYWSVRRLLTELGDARDALWSRIPHRLPLSAKHEAVYLHHWLQECQVIRTYGPHALPPAHANSVRYNVAVAKHLHHLERDTGSSSMEPRLTMPSPTIPQVANPPVIGNILEFQHDPLALFMRVRRECGDIGIFHFGRRPVVMLNAPEHVQAILVEQSDKLQRTPRARMLFHTVFGQSMMTLEREPHKQQRRLVAPAFQHRRITAYAGVMTSYTEQLQHGWHEHATLDLVHEMLRLTLWISGKTLFNTDILHEASALHTAMSDVNTRASAIIGSLVPVPQRWPTPANQRFQQALARLDDTLFPIIAERRRSHSDQGDLLSLLLQVQDAQEGTPLTDQEVRDEALALFIAGHENTAYALAWTWYLVLQHPSVYVHMQREVDRVLGGRRPTVDDLLHLPYSLQVFKEALRLYPPAYVLSRESVAPLKLPGGYHLPAQTALGISPYVLHRQPALFPDPDDFNPDRWTPEHEAALTRYAYLPFGAGPHICIGNHFALMEGHLILATLVQLATFELVPGQHVTPEPLITLRPRGGIKVVVRRRSHAWDRKHTTQL